MIIKSEKVNGIQIYHVEKEIDDKTMETKVANHFLKRDKIKKIIGPTKYFNTNNKNKRKNNYNRTKC